MTRLPSFSALERTAACRASAVLPQADSISDAADAGTVMHAFLHRVGVLRAGGADVEAAREQAALELPEDEQDFLLGIPVDFLPTDPSAFAGEIALAFDAATGKARELGRNIGRRYEEAARLQGKPLTPTEVVGSVDVAALMGDDGVYVADWKRRGRYVARSRENWQVKAGIVAAALAWGRSRARGEIIRIFDDGTEPYRDPWEFGAQDIARAQVELTQLAARVLTDRKAHAAGAEVPAVTGAHCRYCPSFQWCPANGRLAQRLGSEPQVVTGELVALINRENAGELRRRLLHARSVIESAEVALETLASQEAAAGRPLELEPGVFFQPVARTRESLDGVKAEPILRAELGALTDGIVEPSVTKAAIKSALRKMLPGGRGVTKAEEVLLEKLRRAGAVKRTTSYVCAEVRAKTPEAAQQRALPPAEASHVA